ncbi:unnamed protein product [Malus baccata var. baccata]
MFYIGKKGQLNGSPILRQEIRPMQKLWVQKPHCKGTYSISKRHSYRRVDMKNSTTNFITQIKSIHTHCCYMMRLWSGLLEVCPQSHSFDVIAFWNTYCIKLLYV